METPKESWQMTREEYRADIKQRASEIKSGYGKPKPIPRNQLERLSTIGADEAHKYWVQQALSEGKPVPQEVLKDYPELAKQVPAPVQTEQKYPATYAGAEARAQAEGIGISEASRLNAEDALKITSQQSYSGTYYRTGKTQGDVTFFSKNKDYVEELQRLRGKGDIEAETITPRNPLVVDANTKQFSDPSFEKPFIEQAKKQGNDAVIFVDKENGDVFLAKIETPIKPSLAALEPISRPVEAQSGTQMPPEAPDEMLAHAYRDWQGDKAYLDNAGNYRMKTEGHPIAPWNGVVKTKYSKDNSAFHKDSEPYKRKTSQLNELEQIENDRSRLARNKDENLKNKVTVPHTDNATVRIWKRDPGLADIKGIDTPKVRRVTITTELEKPHKPKLRTPKTRSGGNVGREVKWLGRGVYQKGHRRVVK